MLVKLTSVRVCEHPQERRLTWARSFGGAEGLMGNLVVTAGAEKDDGWVGRAEIKRE